MFLVCYFLSSPIDGLLRCVCLKKSCKFIFEITYTFSYRLRNIINKSYQLFLIGLIWFISFCSNLSILYLDTIIGLQNSSAISLLTVTSLSFNSLSSNSINLSLILKYYFLPSQIGSFTYCLSIFSQYLSFYSLDFPS